MKKILLIMVVIVSALFASCEKNDIVLDKDNVNKDEDFFTRRYEVLRLDSNATYVVTMIEGYKEKHTLAIGSTIDFNIHTNKVSSPNQFTRKGIIKKHLP